MRTRSLLPTVLLVALTSCDRQELAPWNSWLSISANTHDFGEIPHGERRTHRFLIENTSPQRVRLKGIRNQCSCAVVKQRVLANGKPVERPIYNPPRLVDGGHLMTWLEPGEQLEFVVAVDTTMRPPVDHVEPSLSELHFSPAEAGKVVLHYKFSIRARLRIYGGNAKNLRPTLELGQHNKNQTTHDVIELAPRDGETFRVLGIEGTDDRLVLEPKPAHKEGGHRWLVSLKPNGKTGPFQRTIGFKTDLGGGYTLPIDVTAFAVGNLQFIPDNNLFFGRFDFAVPRRRFVTLAYHVPATDPGFEIGQMQIQGSKEEDVSRFFEAGVDTHSTQQWTLWLRYKGGYDGKRFQGWLQLKSKDPEHESTVLKFAGYNGERGQR